MLRAAAAIYYHLTSLCEQVALAQLQYQLPRSIVCDRSWSDRLVAACCEPGKAILSMFTLISSVHGLTSLCKQVALAQLQYQLPRLTRMWSHLERQAGGRVRGMGEKQLEVDKRLMRTRIGQLQVRCEWVTREGSLGKPCQAAWCKLDYVVRGMGEKQLEVDKRLRRTRILQLQLL